MLSVVIYIDHLPVVLRTAVNKSGLDDPAMTHPPHTTYRTDDGKLLLHRREDGAVSLAIKLLQAIEDED